MTANPPAHTSQRFAIGLRDADAAKNRPSQADDAAFFCLRSAERRIVA
jgi:hypothetical protein